MMLRVGLWVQILVVLVCCRARGLVYHSVNQVMGLLSERGAVRPSLCSPGAGGTHRDLCPLTKSLHLTLQSPGLFHEGTEPSPTHRK